MSMKVVVFFGTRPEAIKLGPLILALRENVFFSVTVIVSGQHKEMLTQSLSVFGITPDADLDVMASGQSSALLTAKILARFDPLLADIEPDWVVVHGDTTTAFAGALASFYRQIRVAHVEAGLRTFDLRSPFPEEMNRQYVDMISDLHFAPTEAAKQNLIASGVDASSIYVTGNTVIDALFFARDNIRQDKKIRKRLEQKFPFVMEGKKMVLVTMHRQENRGSRAKKVCEALVELQHLEDIQIIFPVHLNPDFKALVEKQLASSEHVKLLEPLNYLEFCFLMKSCYLVVTDSGGIQEEAPAFDKPVLVTRDKTERPEGLLAGTLKVIGSEKGSIIEAVTQLWENDQEYARIANSKNPYGDGYSSRRIVEILQHR